MAANAPVVPRPNRKGRKCVSFSAAEKQRLIALFEGSGIPSKKSFVDALHGGAYDAKLGRDADRLKHVPYRTFSDWVGGKRAAIDQLAAAAGAGRWKAASVAKRAKSSKWPVLEEKLLQFVGSCTGTPLTCQRL